MQIQVSDIIKESSSDRVQVPFFLLQMSQAPGIRRFFEWGSGDAFEESSPFDSVISVRIQVESCGVSRFLVMTHHICSPVASLT